MEQPRDLAGRARRRVRGSQRAVAQGAAHRLDRLVPPHFPARHQPGGDRPARRSHRHAARGLDNPRRQPALEHPHQITERDRLREVRLHPRSAGGGDILGKGIGGQRDHRQQVRPDPLGPDRAGGGIAVAARHLHVHQHQIIQPVADRGIDHHRDRLVPVMRDRHLLPAAFEHLGRQLAVDVVILDQQDPRGARQIARIDRRGLGRGALGRGEAGGQQQREARAFARPAFDLDPPAEQRGQLAADREPEPRPAKAPRGAAVALDEGLEDRLQPALADADPGVGNGDPHLVFAQLPRQPDCSCLGELDRIAEQVEHDLAQPQPVGHHPGPVPRIGIAGEFEGEALLLSRLAMERGAFRQGGVQIDRRVIDSELPAFDLAEIEHVVEQHHHRPSRLHDHFGIALLRGIETALEQQLGKAQYPVHRGADLVAHVGEEFALGAGGVLGIAARAGEQQFQLDPLGHVACGHHHTLALAGGRIADDRAVGLEKHRGAIGIVLKAAVSHALLVRCAVEQPAERQHRAVVRVGMQARGQGFADIGLRRDTHDLAHRGRGIGAHARQVIAQHCVGDVGGEQIDLLLARFERAGHPVAPGEDRGDGQAGEEIGSDEGLQQVELGNVRTRRSSDRAKPCPGHRARHQRHAGDMHRRAEAAEPEGVQQSDRLDQEHQRIVRLFEHHQRAGHPADQQRDAFQRSGRRARQPSAQAVNQQQSGRHQQHHRHAVGQEPGDDAFAQSGQIASHHRCRDQARDQRADQSARPHEARQMAQPGHVAAPAPGLPRQRHHHRDLDRVGQGEHQRHAPRQLGDLIGGEAGEEGEAKEQPFMGEPRAQQQHHRQRIGEPNRRHRIAGTGEQQAEAGADEIGRRPRQRHQQCPAIERPGSDRQLADQPRTPRRPAVQGRVDSGIRGAGPGTFNREHRPLDPCAPSPKCPAVL